MQRDWFKRAILSQNDSENTLTHIHTREVANTPTSPRSDPPTPPTVVVLRPDLTPRHHPDWDWDAIAAAMDAAGWPNTTSPPTGNP